MFIACAFRCERSVSFCVTQAQYDSNGGGSGSTAGVCHCVAGVTGSVAGAQQV